MKKSTFVPLSLVSMSLGVVLVSGAAMANDSMSGDDSFAGSMMKRGPYMGLGYGRSSADTGLKGIVDGNLDKKDKSWKIFGGFNVNEHISLEASYNKLGKTGLTLAPGGSVRVASETLTNTGTTPLKIGTDTKSFGVAAKLGRNMGRFRPFVKLGLHRWNTDLTGTAGLNASVSGDESGTDLFYSLGVEWAASKAVGVQFEYESYDIGGPDVDVLGVALRYSF